MNFFFLFSKKKKVFTKFLKQKNLNNNNYYSNPFLPGPITSPFVQEQPIVKKKHLLC